jgi:hypothetical protein
MENGKWIKIFGTGAINFGILSMISYRKLCGAFWKSRTKKCYNDYSSYQLWTYRKA